MHHNTARFRQITRTRGLLVLVLQHPPTTAATSLLQFGDQLQRFLEFGGCLWIGAVSIEVVNQHLGVDTPTVGGEVISDELAEIFSSRQGWGALSRH